jgi:hypothetical protein
MGAKLEEWQVRPLILGAQASTNLDVGPQHLLPRICGDAPVLGKDTADVDANMESLLNVWNELVFDHGEGRIRLSVVLRAKHPTRKQLVALAARRGEDVIWFLRGLDVGGDDPAALGPEWKHLMRGLAQGSSFLDGIQDLIGRTDEAELGEIRGQIDQVTLVIERIIGNMLSFGRDLRGENIAALLDEEVAGSHGSPVPKAAPRATAKVGRNASCPCGSGRKWKQCCGAPTRLH